MAVVHTLADLTAALEAAIASGGGNLSLDATLAEQIPAVTTLLDALAQPSLLITGAVAASTTTNVTITGSAPLFPPVGYGVTLVGTVVGSSANGVARLQLGATPSSASAWTFDANFAAFPDYFTTETSTAPSFFGDLVLTSPSFAVASFTDPLEDAVEGVTFAATMDARAAPFTAFAPYWPGSAALALSGPIVMRAGAFPLVDLRAPIEGLAYDVGLDRLDDMQLRLRACDATADLPSRSVATLRGTLSLDGTAATTYVFEAEMLRGLDLWAFEARFAAPVALGGKEQLAGFIGSGNPMLLPASLVGSALELQALEFGTIPPTTGTQPSLAFVRARVGTAPWSPPIPKLTIDTVAVEWTFLFYDGAFPTLNQTRLFGSLAIGSANPVHLDVEAAVPGWDFEAGMRDGDTILVADIIEFFTGLSVSLGSLSVTSLNLWGYPSQQEYTLFAEVSGDPPFSVPSVWFNFFNLYVYYTPNSLAAVLSVEIAVGSTRETGKRFAVRAATPADAQSGWLFSGGLVPGQTFSLGDFFAVLLPSWNGLPASLAAIEITELWLTFDTKSGNYSINVRVAWTYQITDYAFDIAAQLSLTAIYPQGQTTPAYSGFVRGDFAINDFAITAIYAFQPKSTTITFEIGYKQLRLSAALVTTEKAGVTSKKIVVRFPDLSLGAIIEYLVNIARPGSDFTLPSPWDALNQITFRDLSLEVDLITNAVSVNYEVKIDLVFVAVSKVRLTYDSGSGSGSVKLGLSARFLSKKYDLDSGSGLEWDVLDEPAPAVTAEGPEFIDLRYLGFGQQVSFAGTTRFDSVAAVIAAMRADMTPVQDANANPLAPGNGPAMRFDRGSELLIGADFTILGTVELALIFNDPYLYGISLGLSGGRAGALDGLRFELLYQRISDDVGVFKIVLQIPKQFRQLEFGAVSITLPVLKLDIYTNGNFRVDLGFPKGGNFADSFCVQVFPFIGYGGFYFALLNGTTSTRVPRITNGTFDPVIEFGIGLRVGLGKEISKGPLSGGLTVTVEGILEGVVGWFTPRDRALTDAKYYWAQGSIGISGRLYAEVDFVVVKASVNVRAAAVATVVFEAYEPIRVALRLTVEASASITILWVDFDFSFDVELDEEFTIGSRSTPPWTLAASAPPSNGARVAATLEYGAQPRLRMQRGHHVSRGRLAAHVLPTVFSQPSAAARARLRAEGGTPDTLNWGALLVLDAIATPGVTLLPSFTAREPANGPAVSEIALVVAIENSVAPGARDEAERRVPVAGHSARFGDVLDAPFNVLLRAMFLWSAYALLGRTTGKVTAADLELLKTDLAAADAGPTYQQLSDFLALNVVFDVAGVPPNFSTGTGVSATAFPMIPELLFSAAGVPSIDFAIYQPVDADYEHAVQDYYAQLVIDPTAQNAADPQGTPAPPRAVTSLAFDDPSESLAKLVFKLYFLMLGRSAVQSALDLLTASSYVAGDESLDQIAAAFTPVTAPYTVRAGDTIASICDAFGMTVQQLQDLNGGALSDPLVPGTALTVQIGVTPETIATANRTVPLRATTVLPLSGVLYQVRAGDSLGTIATSFGLTGGADLVTGANATSTLLLARDAAMSVASTASGFTSFPYSSVAGDTLSSIAVWAYVRAAGTTPDPAVAWYTQTVFDLNASLALDYTQPFPVGTTLSVPGAYLDSTTADAIVYTTRDGDTLDLVARYFSTLQTNAAVLDPTIAALRSLNSTAPWTNLPPGTTIAVPPQTRRVQGLDSFASIAALFGLAPADLGGANAPSTTLLAPLAVVALPDLSVTLTSTDTFAALAARFNLGVAELAADVAGTTKIFPATATIVIPGIPQYDLATLAQQIVLQGGANTAARMTSRFLTSGIQLPVPTATTTFDGLYALAGQQLPAPPSASLPYDITFTQHAVPWVQLVDSTMTGSEDTLAAMLEQRAPVDVAQLARRNPGVDWDAPARAGLQIFTVPVTELVITITAAMVQANAASTTFDPALTSGPAALPLFDRTDVRYTLQTTEHWQTPAPPPYAGPPPPAGTLLAGEPSLWLFSGALTARVAALGSGTTPFGLFTAPAQSVGEDAGEPVTSYDWATAVDVTVQQIVPPGGDGEPMTNTYAFAGTDQPGRDLLLALYQHIASAGNAEANTTIALLYPPNDESNNAAGYASAQLDPTNTFVVRTNLSTLTTSDELHAAMPRAAFDDPPLSYATIAQPASFLELLWQGSVTGTGGYTLQYADAAGGGLPAQVFAASSTGTLKLLVILQSQSAATNPNRVLYTFNNCAVAGDNIDPASRSVYVQAALSTAVEKVKTATTPPGNLGFALQRSDPTALPVTDATRTQTLFSLLGYAIAAGGPFTSSDLGVPIGPAQARVALGQPAQWRYQQLLPVAKFATSSVPDVAAALPARAADPYAGVVPSSQITFDFAFYDLYGNTVPASPVIAPLTCDVGYYDDVIGLSQWPGATADYVIGAAANAPQIAVSIALQVSNYVPAPNAGLAGALRAASAHRARYGSVFYQIEQPDVQFTLSTSLDQAPNAPPAEFPLDPLPLRAFVRAAYVYLGAALVAAPTTYAIGTNDTLTSVAQSYTGGDPALLPPAVAALGTANASAATAALFSGNVLVPQFSTTAYGDTLSEIASAGGVTVLAVAQNNSTVPLNAGVDIAAPARTATTTAGQSVASIAAAVHADAGALCTANATTRGILTEGLPLTVNGVTVTVGTVTPGLTMSFADLVEAFRRNGTSVTPAQIGVANASVENLFVADASLTVLDYVIEPNATFESLAAAYPAFTLAALSAAAQDSPNVFFSGIPVFVGQAASLVPSTTQTLASIAEIYGLSVDQLTAFNALTALASGTLVLPDRVTVAANAAAYAPYQVRTGDAFATIAQHFGEASPEALAARNAGMPNVFAAQQPIAVGTASTTTTAADSIGTVLARLQANDSSVTLAALVAVMGPSTTLLAPGAVLVCALPSTGALGTLQALQTAFGVPPDLLAQTNAALTGFVAPNATVTAGGATLTTLGQDTFAGLVQRFKLERKVVTTVAEIATLNATVSLLGVNVTFVLPPLPASFTTSLGPGYAANPTFPGTIFPLRTAITTARTGPIDTGFTDVPTVAKDVTFLAPRATPPAPGAPLSLGAFALTAESAFAQTIKVALSQADAEHAWIVNFGAGGISSVAIDGGAPSFFARPPLSTSLRDATGVTIQEFDPATGGWLPNPNTLDFQGVDLDVWAQTALSALDLILSPRYAVAAYRQNASALSTLIGAKATLAQNIAAGVTSIYAGGTGVAADAKERLRQELLIELMRGYAVDAIVQYPATVASPYADPKTAPRLSGQPAPRVLRTGATDTIATVARSYAIGEAGLAALLGPVVSILNSNVSVTFEGTQYPITAQSTIDALMKQAGVPGDYEAFVNGLSAPNGFFAPQTTINSYRTTTTAGATIEPATAATLATVAAYFDAPLDQIALQNQDRTGIFAIGAQIVVPNFPPQTVAPNNNSLALMAAAIGLPSATALATAIESAPNVLDPAFAFNLVRIVPAQTLSAAKTSLADGASTVNVLASIGSKQHGASAAQRKKLLLDLVYRINEVEYDVALIPGTGGYERSSWLTFVVPIGGDANVPQPIDPVLGQVEIPVALRSYPQSPLLIDQSGTATVLHPVDALTAKQWTYAFSYQHQNAAQDTVYLQSSYNVGGSFVRPDAFTIADLLANLAQFVSAYPAIQSALAGLLLPQDTVDPVLAQTLATFSTVIANVADTWTYAPPRALDTAALAQATYGYSVSFTTKPGPEDTTLLDTLTLTLDAGSSPSPSGAFPDVLWRLPNGGVWQPLSKASQSAQQCIYTGYGPAALAFIPIEHELTVRAMDVVAQQNAISAVRLTRNERLSNTVATSAAFVYTTAQVTFPAVLSPFITQQDLIPLRQGTETLQQSLQRYFDDLFGTAPSSLWAKVAVQFGYDLVPSTEVGVPPIVSRVPILFMPQLPYDTGLAAQLATALETWQSGKPFSATQGWYVFDVTAYSSALTTTPAPLVDIRNAYFDRSAEPQRAARTVI